MHLHCIDDSFALRISTELVTFKFNDAFATEPVRRVTQHRVGLVQSTSERPQPVRQPALLALTTQRVAVKRNPPERQVSCLEKTRQGGESISGQIDHLYSRQRSPRVVGNGLDLRVAHVQSKSVVEVVTGLEKFQPAAAEAQIEFPVSWRRFVWVR